MVTPAILLDHAEAFIKKVPDRFNNDVVKNAVAEFKAAQAKGGCTGCMKGRTGKPVYDVFEAGVKARDPILLQVWKEQMPAHYIMKIDLMKGTVLTDMVFRPDHADEQQPWEETKL